MIIESINNEKVKYWRKIRTNKYINEYKEYIVEGEHLVEEAIKSGKAKYLILLNGTNYDINLEKYYVTEKVMNSISLLKSIPKVMCVVKIQNDEINLENKIVVLDDVQDPGNVGTIIRTAYAFNFNTIILSNKSANIYNDKVIRASQGMIFHTNIITGDLLEILPKLKEKGFKIYSTLMSGKIKPEEISQEKFAFVLGNEGIGISENVQKLCDNSISIPMNNKCESLNVAISGAIIMYIKR